MSQVVLHSPAGLGAARQQLRAAGRSYAGRRLAAVGLPTLAGLLLLGLLAARWPGGRPMLLAGMVAVLAGAAWQLWPLRRLGPPAVARQLDRLFPELEDSVGLLLQDAEHLSFLGQLQQQRVAHRLEELAATQSPLLPVSFKNSLLISALLLAGSALAWWLPARQSAVASPAAVAVHFSPDAARPVPAAAPRITKVELLVTPPAYTRRAAFAPTAATFQCPQGARVRWLVHVNRTAGAAPTLEIGSQKVALRPAAGLANQFEATQVLSASALYRLRYAGQTSDDYAIDVRPDQAPTIRLQTPKPYTLIAARGTRPEVPIKATLRDDYGLTRAELVITVAQGQGEAVKFHEVRRDLSAGLGGQPSETTVASLLNLPKLGMTYGDELYFYVQARDNNGHGARSDAFIVQWQDTAAAASALDMGMGVNTAPAYFRSERQIIIDTEKLIAEKPKLTAAEFSNRANALGFDQQSLRLRYGKFLGEEAEKGLGVTAGPPTADEPAAPTADAPTADEKPAPKAEADDHDDHHSEAPTGRNASPTATDALMDPYMHKHDDAETADFLEPAVKAKLYAVLDEMWAAELRLRTGQPAAARPYEYRALRLLKQVQQQTRAYVKKAGFTPQPFPESTLRLTGELRGAAAPRLQATVPAPNAQPAVRAALRWLATAQAAPSQPASPADAAALDQAGAALAQAALQKPGLYLPALRALRQLATDARASRVPCATCLAPAQRALADLLPAPVPTAAPPAAPNRLAQRYFQELSR
ncbi:DUF4175 family protein [Hymenobacter ginsengisoli]|uniref:DUF4175 family protein n=1 Tax=Hymenobacter ginsengisoli TaxID=1051626 RepID=A0ABP8QLI1_9BACT|nr:MULTISPECIES: DUF4175 family protein [unclassified Hymenobacter]MBO2029854.1 hypothetical protein [Hymenobacter sp. BT559]